LRATANDSGNVNKPGVQADNDIALEHRVVVGGGD
jgi:hypothetical protein